MKNDKGFQLIELLIVLALASILIAMTVSIGLRAVKDAGYTGAVNKLLAEISYVKQLAAKENRYVALVFNADWSYTIIKQKDITDRDTINVIVRSGNFLDRGNNNKDFYDKGLIKDYSFCVNSMGMIYKKKDISQSNKNPIPTNIIIPVYFKNSSGTIGESDNIIINPSGGVHVKKTKQV